MQSQRRPVTRKTQPPGKGLWFARPQALRTTQKKLPRFWTYFVMGPILYDTLGRYVGLRAPEWSYYVMAFGFACLLVMAIAWRTLESFALRPTVEDRGLSDAPPGLTEYPVEIAIFDAYGCLGVDRGFMWFEDGLLTFNGKACSFVLAAVDVYSRHKRGAGKLHAGIPRDALGLRTPGKTAYVRVAPLFSLNGLTFDYTLGRFLASVSTSERSRQWPPLSAYGTPPEEPKAVLRTPEAIGKEAARTGSAIGVVRKRP